MTQLPHAPSAPASAQTPDSAIHAQIAAELGVKTWQVKAAVELLDGGSTVPFIARYRKEATGTLDDTQLRDLDERLRYLRELEDRRRTVLEAIAAQGQLTPELQAAILAADTKSRLEDIYLPFKSKRRTKAQIAREAGLEPLADALLKRPELDPEREAAKYLNAEHSIDDAADRARRSPFHPGGARGPGPGPCLDPAGQAVDPGPDGVAREEGQRGRGAEVRRLL